MAGTAKIGTANVSLIRDLVEEASEQRRRADNVILRGITENTGEDLKVKRTVAQLVPDLDTSDILSAERITPRRQTEQSRLVRATLTSQGKTKLMRNKTRAKHHDVNVYVSHDSTRGKQERRCALVLPQYKALRSKGIVCHLPKDTITHNGKSLTPSDVEGLLKVKDQ